ncbi:MAG: 30S ribosomal protein S8 [bacterium]|nr:MAG: 30S ribosomal protein S8 [bacterium]
MTTDPVADMLTRIRNAIMAGHDRVNAPASQVKIRMAEILKEEGYINNFKVVKDCKQGTIRIYLKYHAPKQAVIVGLRRISRPGRRVYVAVKEIPRVLRGIGTVIISTNKGILTDSAARSQNCGGEVLCYIW